MLKNVVMKALKWIGIGLGGLIVLVVIALVVGYFRGQAVVNSTFDVPLEEIGVSNDPELIARGEVLVNVTSCVQCHGRRVDGQDIPIAYIAQLCAGFARECPPNLTTGEGGVAARYSDAEIERAVRHGVRQDGTSLFEVMPSERYNSQLSDDEMAAIIAYLRYGAEPVDHGREEALNPVMLGGMGLGLAGDLSQFLAAAHIDHSLPHAAARPVEIGPTAEYGEYLNGISCAGCHFKGQQGLPDVPAIPENLLLVRAYSEEEFFFLLREATARDGRVLHRMMEPYRVLPDEEIRALYLYLMSDLYSEWVTDGN